jgi:hypothetical protein
LRIGRRPRISSPGATDRLEPGHPVAGDAVLERVRAAGVRRDVAADLRLLGGAGIGREQQAALARDAPQRPRGDPGLDLDPPELRLERADPG